MVGQAVRQTAPPDADAVYAGTADGDLRDGRACRTLFETVRPTHVIHLAARVGGVLENTRYIGEFFHDNLLINVNVLESARRLGVHKLVSLLSSCIYPDGITLPLRESELHAGEPHPSNFGYAYAKRMLEVQSRAYARQYDARFACVIPNNIFGPHDNFDLEAGHVIPAMIRKIHAAKVDGAPAVLWGDGTPRREFTFSRDIGQALWWALRSYDDAAPLNIGTNEEVSIRHAAETICRRLDHDASRLEWDTGQPQGQDRKPTDTTRFRALAGLTPTPFDEGVDETVRWYVERFPKVRGVS